MKTKLLFLHALSPLHAGTGQGVGVIDLPIAREKATGIPIVPGSSIKGVLRANCEDEGMRTRVFGPETNHASDHAGSIQFSDLRLLFLPVRSLSGVFAWVTSPFLLRRFQRDAQMAGQMVPSIPQMEITESTCLVAANDSQLLLSIKGNQQVVLEDLPLEDVEMNGDVSSLADWLAPQIFDAELQWSALFKQRLCVVHDNVLSFLLDTATEVTARIQLDDEKKTVKPGALWYEEALPAESILVGLVVTKPVEANEDEVIGTVNQLAQKPLQVGGSATVGRGLCKISLV
jgi:CRISPR-associated protein Cmr4